MIHPSYVELMKVVNKDAIVGEEPVINSRYSIVCATAKRARQIIDGRDPLITNTRGMKPLSIAVEELNSGVLKILTEDEVLSERKNEEKIREEKARRREEEKQKNEAKKADRDMEEEPGEEIEYDADETETDNPIEDEAAEAPSDEE